MYHAWEPQGGLKVTVFSAGSEERSIAELVLVSLVWQSKPNVFRSSAFNASAQWFQAGKLLSQLWTFLFHRKGWKFLGQEKVAPIPPYSRFWETQQLVSSIVCDFDFSLGKKNTQQTIRIQTKLSQCFKYEHFQILKFWEESWERKKSGEGLKIFHPSYHFFQCLHNCWSKGKTVLKAIWQLIKYSEHNISFISYRRRSYIRSHLMWKYLGWFCFICKSLVKRFTLGLLLRVGSSFEVHTIVEM